MGLQSTFEITENTFQSIENTIKNINNHLKYMFFTLFGNPLKKTNLGTFLNFALGRLIESFFPVGGKTPKTSYILKEI